MHIGRLCVALFALASLPSPAVFASIPDPALRRSEQLDARRLGKVSEDERSVLRVEWRAALSAEEEAHSVQEILQSLRRMEETVVEISRLLRGIPVQKPVVAAVAAEPPRPDSPVQKPLVAAVPPEPPKPDSPVQKPLVAAVAPEPPKPDSPARKPVVAAIAPEPAKSDSNSSRLLLANIAAACLVALWWFRGRRSARNREAVPGTAPEAGPPDAAPLTIMPAPQVTTAPARAPTVATPVTVPAVAQTASPKRAETKPPAPAPAAETHVIDYSVDEAAQDSRKR